jgi:hypothetical protein
MTTSAELHQIPVARRVLVKALAEELEPDQATAFGELVRLLIATFHFEFHDLLEDMKACYAPLNPDDDGRGDEGADEAQLAEASNELTAKLGRALERANYVRLTGEAIEYAFREFSLFPLQLLVDFDMFDDYLVFYRGETLRQSEVKRWFGLRRTTIEVPTFDRVCVFIRFKPEGALSLQQRKQLHQHEPGSAILKLFRNIPKADLEMLFPNTQLRMRLRDKLLIGVPALVGGVPVALKLVPALLALAVLLGIQRGEVNLTSIVAGLSGLVGLGLFLFRQWDKFQHRKVGFLKTLSENLYFRNLDNNQGVLTRLVDEAEEEEVKEALCAYRVLLDEPGLDEATIDRRVEDWLRDRFGLELDFEIDDALAKLVRLGLAERDDEGRYRVLPVDQALTELDRRWDDFFSYHSKR